MSVSEGNTDLPANTTTRGRVLVGDSVTGEVATAGDVDWFAVELMADRTYHFDLKGSITKSGTLWDPYLRGIYDSSNDDPLDHTTDNDSGASRNSRVVFTPDEDGTYYVAAGGHRIREGTYTLSVTDVTDGVPDDLPANRSTTGTVTVDGDPATGEIQYFGDRDWFAVTLEEGKIYQIDLEGWRNGGGTLLIPYLGGIYDSSSDDAIDRTWDQGSGAGFNAMVVFVPTTDGTYYVAAGGHEDGEGTYRLSVTDITDRAPDDLPADRSTTGRVTVNGDPMTCWVNYMSDRDWFAVELDADKTYRVDLEGWFFTRMGTLIDPYLYGIYDSSNDDPLPDTTDDDSGLGYNSRVYFTPTDDGTYYVAAGAHGNGHGSYALSVTEVTDEL